LTSRVTASVNVALFWRWNNRKRLLSQSK